MSDDETPPGGTLAGTWRGTPGDGFYVLTPLGSTDGATGRETYTYTGRSRFLRSAGTVVYQPATGNIVLNDNRYGPMHGKCLGGGTIQIHVNRWIGLMRPHTLLLSRSGPDAGG